MKLFTSRRKLFLLAIDVAIMLFTYMLLAAISLITNNGLPMQPIYYVANFLIFAACIIVSRVIFGIYSNVLRYANSYVYFMSILADLAGGAVAILVTYLIPERTVFVGLANSALFVCASIIATLSSRFCYQLIYKHINREHQPERDTKIGVAIVGAGQVGALLAEELIYNGNSHYKPICFIDKDKNKIGSRVCGLEVYHEGYGIIKKIKSLPIQEIFIAIPSLSGPEAGALHDLYAASGCKVKIYDFPIHSSENTGKRVLREFKIEDLLFRKAIDMYGAETKAYYSNRVVLVTGGGGSIGSELCRQIAACEPKKLIIFDIYENNAYEIEQELRRKYGTEFPLFVEIGSVRDRQRLDSLFTKYKPEIVIHAAAHKHVPLMENSSGEAIKNNVLGTYNTADMAEKHGVEKFILISTDKAVNPTNVMGASKRLCEMVIQSRSDSNTAFCAVRFGNVLGSNGSVIPLFRRQIAQGGPVTVTDKRIIRYFMTIPEASGLVMEAGAMAKRGELFVLNMGKPVRILDLAENMIRLSGYVPYVDIDIVEMGLRPGEKLYEELLIKTENLERTANNLIFVEHDTPYTRARIDEMLDVLRDAIRVEEDTLTHGAVKRAMMDLVPTFHDPEEVNKSAESCYEMKLASR